VPAHAIGATEAVAEAEVVSVLCQPRLARRVEPCRRKTPRGFDLRGQCALFDDFIGRFCRSVAAHEQRWIVVTAKEEGAPRAIER
jgi:hypothetical protein